MTEHRHGHSHGSRLTLTGQHRKSLVIVLLITLSVAVAGIGLSPLVVVFASRPATQQRTFGYARAEILAAVVNAVVLFGISIFVIFQAISRLVTPIGEWFRGAALPLKDPSPYGYWPVAFAVSRP